jgi:hypothetical protein
MHLAARLIGRAPDETAYAPRRALGEEVTETRFALARGSSESDNHLPNHVTEAMPAALILPSERAGKWRVQAEVGDDLSILHDTSRLAAAGSRSPGAGTGNCL